MSLRISHTHMGSIYGEEERKAVLKALEELSHSPARPHLKKFEEEFARYVGSEYAFGVSSCTAALHIATQLLRIRPGDEVIVTPLTFIATSLPLLKAGAKVVFADIHPRTYNIDPADVERKISARTKAIYVVDFAGQPVDLEPLMKIAQERKIWVVEDAAHSPGAEYKGRKVGSIAHITCFSFHYQKNITTLGEGGMITGILPEWREEIRILREMGLKPSGMKEWFYPYDVVDIQGELGNNFRMTDIQGAVGLVQLKKLDYFNERRRQIAHYLTGKLKEIEEVIPPYELPYVKHVYHLYPVRFLVKKIGAKKEEIVEKLREKGIGVGLHYLPNYLHSVYSCRGYQRGLCPVAEEVFEELINLPLHPSLTLEDAEFIIRSVKETIRELRK